MLVRADSRLASNMRASGWKGPPVKVFEQGGVKYVLDGHHRLAAAREAGLTSVPYETVGESELRSYGYQSLAELLSAADEAFGR
jgi:ParB-like nuclease domain